mgnify:CR=1 FL=1
MELTRNKKEIYNMPKIILRIKYYSPNEADKEFAINMFTVGEYSRLGNFQCKGLNQQVAHQ